MRPLSIFLLIVTILSLLVNEAKGAKANTGTNVETCLRKCHAERKTYYQCLKQCSKK